MATKTALYDIHIKHNGDMVDFCGFELPIKYTSIIEEHKAVRESCGIFDVSHMGEILVTGEGALHTLNYILANSFDSMDIGRCRYSMMLYDNGTIVDDVLVYKVENNSYLVVVNASNKDKDYEWIQSHKRENTSVTDASNIMSQIALQGPFAEDILSQLVHKDFIPSKNYTFTKDIDLLGAKVIISRTGYTGEDGFEIYADNINITKIWEALFETGRVVPCGLGARDTLRLEAGMPLYGHELSDTIRANEVGMSFSIKMNKDFIGKEALENNPAEYKQIGLELVDKGIAREGNEIFVGKKKVGFVTSGTKSPLTKKSIAIARIEKDITDNEMIIDIRGKQKKAKVVAMPFNK